MFVFGVVRMDVYLLDLQKVKGVGLVVNFILMVGSMYLVDMFLVQGVNVRQIFVLEYGFWGIVDVGEMVMDGKDK